MARGLGRLKQEAIEEPTVNLTPLIDVVFVILIGFIMIAPLLEVDQIELAEASIAPSKDSLSVQETSPIVIHVREDNTVLLGGKKVDFKTLKRLLEEAKIAHPKVTPQLFHDKKAFFGTYQTVKNALEEAGFDQVDVILKPS